MINQSAVNKILDQQRKEFFIRMDLVEALRELGYGTAEAMRMCGDCCKQGGKK